MFEVLATLVIYVLYLALRERLFSPIYFAFADLVFCSAMLVRVIVYDETIPVYLLVCIACGSLLRSRRRDTPPAAP